MEIEYEIYIIGSNDVVKKYSLKEAVQYALELSKKYPLERIAIDRVQHEYGIAVYRDGGKI